MRENRKCHIEGTVAPGFESVQRLYEHNMNTLAEENTQLCVYHKGKKVVDLWASATNDSNFSPDSLINIFSSGKSLESIAMASLVDKGLLSYDARITDYWPEFAVRSKGDLTVAQLMRHEAGLANLNVPMALDDLLTENIKQDNVGRIIAAQTLSFPRGGDSNREYHAITRGWIVNEIFRRVDPAGRTVGEFLRQDISQPLDVEAIVGVQQEDLARIVKVTPLGFKFHFLASLRPKFLGRQVVHNIFQILGRILRILPMLRHRKPDKVPPPFKGMRNIAFFNETGVAMGETPSANTHSTARSLAKIAAMMSAGGKWEGREYLGAHAWQALHENPVKATMGGLLSTRFTQGGVDMFTQCTADSPKLEREFNQGREGFYGWMGLGGSIFQWHPGLNIGFGFVPTSLHVLDILNERGKAYQAEVLKCIAAIATTTT